MKELSIIRQPALLAAVLAVLVMGRGLRPAHAEQSPRPMPPSSEQGVPKASSDQPEQKDFEARISVKAPLVNVEIFVTDQDGRVLSGLKKDNFRILEDGRAQTITHFESANAPITIAMLMEYSGRAYNHFAYKAASWGTNFLNHLDPLDWVALVTFDIKPTVKLDFTRNKGEMQRVLNSLSFPQFREAITYDAITDTLDRLDRVKGKKAILLISTGANTLSAGTLDTLKRIKHSDVTIVSVGLAESEYLKADVHSSGGRSIGYLQAENELQSFAKLSGGHAWFPRFEGEIQDIFKSVAAFLRSRYSIGFSLENLPPDGKYRKLKVEIVQPDGTPLMVTTPKGKRQKPVVYAREGYTAPSGRVQDGD